MAPVLIYDGECGFCSRWVRFVRRWERHSELVFLPSRSPGISRYLDENVQKRLSETVVVIENGRTLERSDAVISVLKRLRFFRVLVPIVRLIPREWRDAAYDRIARRRHALSGQACDL